MTRYWLLDLEFAGQTLRLSTADLDIASDAGDLHYVGTLQDVQLSEALELLDAQLPEASVSMPCGAWGRRGSSAACASSERSAARSMAPLMSP